jgi:hypothetical protein
MELFVCSTASSRRTGPLSVDPVEYKPAALRVEAVGEIVLPSRLG